MNIPKLTPDGVYIAVNELAQRGVAPYYTVDISARCVWVLWLFMVGQEDNVWKN